MILKVLVDHKSLVFSMDDLRSLLLVDLVSEELLCEYFHTHFGLVILTLLFLCHLKFAFRLHLYGAHI